MQPLTRVTNECLSLSFFDLTPIVVAEPIQRTIRITPMFSHADNLIQKGPNLFLGDDCAHRCIRGHIGAWSCSLVLVVLPSPRILRPSWGANSHQILSRAWNVFGVEGNSGRNSSFEDRGRLPEGLGRLPPRARSSLFSNNLVQYFTKPLAGRCPSIRRKNFLRVPDRVLGLR